MRLAILIAAALLVFAGAAQAQQGCQDRSDVLGTSRILEVDVATSPRVGRQSFPHSLPLHPKEVVLTFDDGPWPVTTPRILAALKAECVKASFFMIGRNAVASPELARRVLADGHTVGYHSFSHPWLSQMSPAAAIADINRGFQAIDSVLYGKVNDEPSVPFFRFPGFTSTPFLLDHLERRGIVVFGADSWPGDWIPMTPEVQLRVTLQQLDAAHGGILLLHDTKFQTAEMVPGLLKALKARGYRIVHIIPKSSVVSPAPVVTLD